MPLDAGQILRCAPLIDPNLSGSLAFQAAGDYERLSYQGRLSTAVVHLICNQGVTGSNPVAGTNEINTLELSCVPRKLARGT
jgi:hypothetical protein